LPGRVRESSPRRRALLALLIVVTACGPRACGSEAESAEPRALSEEWIEFHGSWNAAGRRRRLWLGADRSASIVELQGTMLLEGPDRPGAGFRSEVIGLADSASGFVGRGVWTDERGDQVFSELRGEGTEDQNRITGTILGGTGRYAGAAGTYEFSWQWVMEAEDGAIQGRAVDLKGRVRSAERGSPR